ncbi:hypothetical protein [Flavobacterium limicola]|uniref:hypothetical protein n=1 Tax=Flavobacterium limicola TaxID=180441 RepID=UPI000EB14CA0|nr:hypothetical protein [Flavobacterium limicola]
MADQVVMKATVEQEPQLRFLKLLIVLAQPVEYQILRLKHLNGINTILRLVILIQVIQEQQLAVV